MFKLLRLLLPRGRAWLLMVSNTLRKYLEGFTVWAQDARDYIDAVWFDLDPQTTTKLNEWEKQFNLPSSETLTEQERRDRLIGRWASKGGQSPRYIQDTLQAAGFDVYIHEWWDYADTPAPGVKVCVTPRDPRFYLEDSDVSPVYSATLGNGQTMGDGETMQGALGPLPGYLLVNKVLTTSTGYNLRMGNGETMGGGETMQGSVGITDFIVPYAIPDDPAKWPYFGYVGGATFPDVATVPASRRDEFEELLLKIFPRHVWIGVLVSYV